MAELLASEAELNARREGIPRLLKTLVPDVPWIGGAFDHLGAHEWVIALRQGPCDMPYDRWRVSSKEKGIALAYYEVWKYVGNAFRSKKRGAKERIGKYVLTKAYLHLYRPVSGDAEEELIFMHCDPLDESRYKVAPHVHFEVAGYPWRKAHIALCDGWQNEVLRNLECLDAAIGRAVDMIAKEFIPLLNE